MPSEERSGAKPVLQQLPCRRHTHSICPPSTTTSLAVKQKGEEEEEEKEEMEEEKETGEAEKTEPEDPHT